MNFRIQAHAYVIPYFFGLIKTHIFCLVKFVRIVVTFQTLWCLVIYGTYIFGFNHVEFIHRVVNYSAVLLFFLVTFFRHGIYPAVLCWLGHSILSSKFSQNLTFTQRMSKAMDHIVFRCALRVNCISFTSFASAPTLRGVSP